MSVIRPGLFVSVFSPRVVGNAVARYDFCSRDTRELSLLQGDFIRIYTKMPNGWWKGEVDGRVGLLQVPHITHTLHTLYPSFILHTIHTYPFCHTLYHSLQFWCQLIKVVTFHPLSCLGDLIVKPKTQFFSVLNVQILNQLDLSL